MGTFSYTTVKPKPISMGNRRGYIYKLVDVQTTGSKLTTPFKKITGVLMQTLSPVTSDITWTKADKTGNGTRASLTFAADAESQGSCVVVGI